MRAIEIEGFPAEPNGGAAPYPELSDDTPWHHESASRMSQQSGRAARLRALPAIHAAATLTKRTFMP